MSDKKYTPGPWEAGFGGGINGDRAAFTVFLDESGCKEIPVKVRGSTDMICVIPYSKHEQIAIADANLIAAAPELLEALEAIVGLFDPALIRVTMSKREFMIDTLEIANKAIAKAKGNS